ncbi:hypothetical protein M885DRAFT_569271 [Pelagophyceae sp. CCMP2097]|nr:hypothetical protein M885DRAFT_569271 [Pelagophyceae sp. CCMP2097]
MDAAGAAVDAAPDAAPIVLHCKECSRDFLASEYHTNKARSGVKPCGFPSRCEPCNLAGGRVSSTVLKERRDKRRAERAALASAAGDTQAPLDADAPPHRD